MSDARNVALADPMLGDEEKRALLSVIDSNWLTMGPRVAEFEQAFARLHGLESAVAVNSCTAGLHLGLLALGVGPGDEVLVPSLTFVATANAVLYTGATPVFVDIESPERPHLSIADAETKCTDHTRAVIVMHYGGYLVDLPAWRSFADAHRMFLIEDAAHAAGVTGVGRLSDAAAFSFFPNKNMTTAEGGMILARDESVLERTRRLRAHGMTTNTLERDRGHAHSYDVTMLGYNYRMDELRAALGLVQLKRLREWNTRRRALTELYRQKLRTRLPELIVPFDASSESACHLMPVVLPVGKDRSAIMENMRAQGVQTSIHYPAIHAFSYYRDHVSSGTQLRLTEEFAARELTLPLHPALSEQDVESVVIALLESINLLS